MATNSMQIFQNPAFGTIRTINQEGRILFCGKDVATALGYQNTNKALSDHCRGVTNRYPITDSLGRTQEARFITEGDLYRLIAASKLPAAQAFETWVFDTVLPSIRTTGAYLDPARLADPQFLIQILETLKVENTRRLAAEQALAEVEPKVSYYDLVLQSRDSLTIRVIAKDYGLSAQRLNEILHELGIQYKQSGTWLLYQKFAGHGYTDTKTHIINDAGRTRIHTYWTQKGRLFIYETLKAHGILPIIEQETPEA